MKSSLKNDVSRSKKYLKARQAATFAATNTRELGNCFGYIYVRLRIGCMRVSVFV